MDERERSQVSLGGLLANEPRKAFLLQRTLHGTHAVLPLGMPERGLVVDPGRATEKERAHLGSINSQRDRVTSTSLIQEFRRWQAPRMPPRLAGSGKRSPGRRD